MIQKTTVTLTGQEVLDILSKHLKHPAKNLDVITKEVSVPNTAQTKGTTQRIDITSLTVEIDTTQKYKAK